MNGGENGLTRLDTVMLIWAGVTYLLLHAGRRLWRGK